MYSIYKELNIVVLQGYLLVSILIDIKSTFSTHTMLIYNVYYL